jgi:DNA-directed RNA polymerase specialized sigma24 family protein
MAELKKDWILNPEAFRRLLNWLDSGNDSEGERYLEVRRRLTTYFDRKNCPSSDELADETLNRIARKLEEKGTITEVSPLHYCYIVAKFVFLESARRAKPIQTGTTELMSSEPNTFGSAGTSHVGTSEVKEKMFDCLERCLSKLPPGDRELILEYYRGEQRVKIERRSALAAHLGVTMNALSIRACRIRNKLEACVRACSKER